MRFLRSNTAVIISVGPFFDKTDGVTIETALTITNERITLTADTDDGSAPTNILDNVTGATSATSNDLNYITGNDAGMMQLELSASDTNRVGRMFLSITDAANHVPVFHEFFVLPQAIYDWLTGVIVPLPTNVTQLLGTAWLTPGTAGTPDVNMKLAGGQTVSAAGTVTLPGTVASTTNITAGTITTVTNVTTVDGLAAGVITAASIAADAITDASVASDVTIASVTGAVGSVTGLTASDVGAIKTVTDQFVFTVANQVDANAVGGVLDAAGVRTAVGLATANLDTQIATLSTQVSVDDLPTNTELATALGTADDATLAAIAALNNIAATDIVSAGPITTLFGAVVNVDTVAGVTGLTVSNLDVAVSTLATAANLASVADYLDTEIAAILADTNELQVDWVDGGRLDLILDARASQTSVDDLPTNAELTTELAGADDATLAAIAALNNLSALEVNAECDTAISDAVLATAANLATVAGYLDTEIADIKTKTDQLTFTVANQVDSNALSGGGGLDAAGVRAAVGLATANLDTQLGAIDDFLDTEVSAIKAKTDNLPASPAAVGSAMTLASSLDLYHSDIQFNDDGSNNEYTVVWFKNGVRVTSGITSPTIQVVSRSDGTDFIASTPMTQIGTTGAYKFTTATVITAGETYLVIAASTIDAGSRSFSKLISRDA